jgi:hypothetical protein
VRDTEKLTTALRIARDASSLDSELAPPSYETYATPFQDTFDDTVTAAQSIVREFTLEEQVRVWVFEGGGDSHHFCLFSCFHISFHLF